jgi:hypothetical protein
MISTENCFTLFRIMLWSEPEIDEFAVLLDAEDAEGPPSALAIGLPAPI